MLRDLLLLASLAVSLPAAASGSGGSTAAPPETSCAESVASRVQSHYDGVRDLRGRFEQTSLSVAFGGAADASQTLRGEVVFAKPGRMRWHYESPEPSLVVSDGETLWIHDPVAKEVQVLPVSQGFLSGAALQFLLGSGRILDTFEVRARDCGGPSVALELRPREPASYEHLELRADPRTGAISETTVVDLFGNRTRVVFQDLKTNLDPPPAVFRFDPPAGTRILSIPKAP